MIRVVTVAGDDHSLFNPCLLDHPVLFHLILDIVKIFPLAWLETLVIISQVAQVIPQITHMISGAQTRDHADNTRHSAGRASDLASYIRDLADRTVDSTQITCMIS